MKRVLFALFALSLAAGAADLTTKNGKVYKNYDVDRATPYGVAIFHDGGSATVPYADLPDELRKKYSEEEKQAAGEVKRLREVARKEAEERAMAEFLKTKEERFREPRIISILPQGVLAEGTSLNNGFKTFWITDAKIDGKTDGAILSNFSSYEIKEVMRGPTEWVPSRVKVRWLICYEIGTHSYINTRGARCTVKKYTANKQKAYDYHRKRNKK